jgi:hypothetical protein
MTSNFTYGILVGTFNTVVKYSLYGVYIFIRKVCEFLPEGGNMHPWEEV